MSWHFISCFHPLSDFNRALSLDTNRAQLFIDNISQIFYASLCLFIFNGLSLKEIG
jgi:hypothetical protein